MLVMSTTDILKHYVPKLFNFILKKSSGSAQPVIIKKLDAFSLHPEGYMNDINIAL